MGASDILVAMVVNGGWMVESAWWKVVVRGDGNPNKTQKNAEQKVRDVELATMLAHRVIYRRTNQKGWCQGVLSRVKWSSVKLCLKKV